MLYVLYILLCVYICLFFKYTATTAIYTYSHTLSRHDALPIFTRDDNAKGQIKSGQMLMADVAPGTHRLHAAMAKGLMARSEEHTSELQSLMRISYAVFCLQKKKNRQQIIQHKDSNH